MKIASIFGKKNNRKNAESFIENTRSSSETLKSYASPTEKTQTQKNSSEIFVSSTESPFIPSSIQEQKHEKAQYIFNAINKAEERKYIQEEVKNKRLERELQQWEKEHDKALRFSTFGDNIDKSKNIITEEENDSKELEQFTDQQDKEIEKTPCLIPSEEEFEAMKERYMKRMEATGILQFTKDKKGQIELLYYPEICGIPVIT